MPSNEMLRLRSELLVGREVQVTRPVNDLPIRIVRLLRAERWPADQALEHDRSNTPPITPEVVTLPGEDFRSNVIRCADG